jgi:hypothetical protein
MGWVGEHILGPIAPVFGGKVAVTGLIRLLCCTLEEDSGVALFSGRDAGCMRNKIALDSDRYELE